MRRRLAERVVRAADRVERLAWYRELGRLLERGAAGRNGHMNVRLGRGINGRTAMAMTDGELELERAATAMLRQAGLMAITGMVRV